MLPTELVNLTALMERTSGSPDVKIGLVDGLARFIKPMPLSIPHKSVLVLLALPNASANAFRKAFRRFSAVRHAAGNVGRQRQLAVLVSVSGSVPTAVRGPAPLLEKGG